MVSLGNPPPFVGRQRELAHLLVLLDHAQAGRGSLALVAGEPGIGKTRLVSELAEHARTKGWRVLAGQAHQAEGVPPYLPFIQALRNHVQDRPPEELGAQLGDGAAEVTMLIPELSVRLPVVSPQLPLSPEHERYRLFESISDFLLAIARTSDHGLLLILDDLHAADRSTLSLLCHLARKRTTSPLLLVGTYRTQDVEHGDVLQDVLADLSRDARCDHLPLAALSADAVAMMVAGIAGVPVAPAVATAICRQTGGNPFFVREVVRHLQADDRDLTDSRTATDDWGIPEGVRLVLAKRLSRLSPVVRRVLEAAAVLGDGMSFEVLAATSGLDEDTFVDAVDEVLRAGVIREDGAHWHFSHALVRETVYAGVTQPRKQRLHLHAAEALVRLHHHHLDPYVAAVATQYRLAGALADPVTVLAYAERAAAAAAAVFAWEEAVTHWQTALALLDDHGSEVASDARARRGTLLLELGQAQGRSGDVRGARESFRHAAAAARRLGAPDQLARAALGYGEVYVSGSDVDPFLVGLLEEALAGLPAEAGELRARLLASLAMALRYAPEADRKAGLVREAVASARRSADHKSLAYALTVMHVANWQPGNAAERLAAATEAVRLAEPAEERELACWGHHWRAIDLLEIGDIAALDVELEAHRRLAEELRAPYYLWNSLRLRATRAMMGGALVEGERLAWQAFDVGRRVDPTDAHAMYLTQIWNNRLWQGRLVELLADWERYCEYYHTIPAWRARLAWLYAELGREREARRELDRLALGRFAALPQEMHWLSGITFLAEACVRLGDKPHAATLYELLQPYSGFNVRSGGYPVSLACFGSASRPLGMLAAALGDWDAAERYFEDAIAMNTRMGAWPWVARSQHAHAAMLLIHHARSDLPRARHLLEQAIAHFDRLGMVHDAAIARGLLPAPRLAASSSPAGIDHLTPREIDVVRLIAAGLSNREIAERLVLSERTVERHIANIYEKLALHGKAARAALTAHALRHHLVGSVNERA